MFYRYKIKMNINILLFVSLFNVGDSFSINNTLPVCRTNQQSDVEHYFVDTEICTDDDVVKYQYLDSCIVSGKNVLIQEMLAKSNTIYIIQYDYDLQGTEIILPKGCTLDFQGGSFRNGSINGNGGTLLNYPNYNIFNDVLIYNFNIDYCT